MKFFALLLITIFAFVNIQAQERWSTTRKPVMGSYTKLPSETNSWQNTNRTIQVYNQDNMVITVGPSVRVLPTANAQQDEIVLVRHPLNQNIMFGGANTTVGGVFGQGGYITTDGGASWTGNNLLPPFSQSSSDPAPTIDKNGVIIFTTLDSPGSLGMVSAYSTNNGSSWSSKVSISSVSSDKNFAASDDAPSSPYYGRSYAVWSNFSLGSPPIVFSYTTNSGVSWNGVTQINTPPGGHYSQGCDIMCGPTGTIYVCWAQVNSSGLIEDYCGFASSTNGGASWTVLNNAYDMNGIRATSFNGWNFRVNGFTRIGVDRSGGPRNGWIYIVAAEKNLAPAGTDADVVLHSSSDGGATWSAGVRVNQDPLNNGKVQFFPAIRVDESGGVNVCYYDNRNYPSVGDSCETYMSRSVDGGATWSDVKVSDHAWKVKGEAGLGSYGGDYIGISSGNGKVFPFWFDDKTGTMQAWVAAVTPDPVGITGNTNEIPASFELSQNYPNPFNPNTTIGFALPSEQNVKLEVFDMTGKSAGVLVNSDLKAGTYKFDFNASDLASGIYFYKLISGNFVSTKKMILVK
ncbi:MAG: T9SS type A sorting domain-containing protein [Ignavibacteria bacterium]|nr:T9SS type A sorting domain-containing protein [Ignavibacteria bacterium]